MNMEHEICQVILRTGSGKRENNGSDESNLGIIYAYVAMSQ
jgi:hypothetical protein